MKTLVSVLAAGVVAMFSLVSLPAAQAQSNYPRWETYPSYSGGYYTPNRGWYYDYYHTGTNRQTQGQQLRGEVLRTKHVELQGTNIDHLAALIETTDGRRVVADLGPVENLDAQGLQLQRGEQISARGRMTRIGEHPVFIAQQLRADGQTVAIQRRQRPTQQLLQEEEQEMLTGRSGQGGYPRGSAYQDEYPQGRYRRGLGYTGRGSGMRQGQQFQEQQVRGQIQNMKWVQLPGLQNEMLIAQIKSDSGRQWIVDLGTEPELEHLQLNKGDRVSAQGRCFFVGGQPVLLAEQVQAHGQTASIEQTETPLSTQQVRGQVTRVQRIDVPGMRSPVLIAQVQADNGRRCLVALGTPQELQDVKLDQGDQISVRGPALQVGNRRFIVGQQLSAHGETVPINQQGEMTRRGYEEEQD